MNATTSPNRLSARTIEDYALVQTAISGNQKAYAELLDRYRAAIFNMMYKMVNNRTEADDLTIEAFGKAFHKLPSYAPRYAFSTWLFKIAINNCIDHVRKKRLNMYSSGDPYGNSDGDFDLFRSVKADGNSPEDAMIRDQKISMMRHLLDRMSDKYRTMIELRYYEELSYDEIAQQMQIPLGTVKAQLFRAKEILYQMLQSPFAKSYLERTTRHEELECMPGESLVA